MKRPVIRIRNLKKSYKTHKREPGLLNAIKSIFKRQYVTKNALRGVSFDIYEGEIVGLIGPNGAGKSTTIKVLSGVLYPTSGNVKVLRYTPWEDREEYVKHMGVVFGQKQQLYWDVPAEDTYELFKDLYDIPERTYKERLEFMTRYLDAEDIIKKPVRDLSLGERMKCKIIAALIYNPEIVFLDEPTIGLDAIAKENLRDFIKYINKKFKTTFIVTTHDMQDIEKLCPRIIIINHGEVVYDGPLQKITDKYLVNKVLDVKLEEPAKIPFEFPGCTVLKRRRYELKIEVDTREQTIKDVIDYISKKYAFSDIVVSNPAVEKIIQQIYEETKK